MASREQTGILSAFTGLWPIASALVLALAPAPAQCKDPGDDDEFEDPPKISFEVPEVTAHPGELVDVPFSVTTDAALSLAVFSLEYEPVAVSFSESALGDAVQRIVDSNPGDSELNLSFDDEAGHVQAALVTDFLGREAFSIPAGTRTQVAMLKFQVKPDAPEGRHPLSFTRQESADYDSHYEDGAKNSVYNSARKHGTEFNEETEWDDNDQPVFLDGAVLVSIIGDVSVFARGDANIDGQLDLSDPVRILYFLFVDQAAGPLSCADAADANDDGKIDLSDAITILKYLFVDSSGSQVSEVPAADLTPDSLGCAVY